MREELVALVVVAVIAVLVVIAVVIASGPATPLQSYPDGREGPGDVVDNDHDDYPHDCLIGDLCTPFPMP